MKDLRYLSLLCMVRALICPDKHSCFNKEHVCLRPNKHLRQVHHRGLADVGPPDITLSLHCRRQAVNQADRITPRQEISLCVQRWTTFLKLSTGQVKTPVCCPVLCFRCLERCLCFQIVQSLCSRKKSKTLLAFVSVLQWCVLSSHKIYSSLVSVFIFSCYA